MSEVTSQISLAAKRNRLEMLSHRKFRHSFKTSPDDTISIMNLEDIIQAIKPLHHWDKVHPDTMGKWLGYETYTKHKNLLRIMYFSNSIHIYLYDVEYNLILNKSFNPDISSKDIIDYLTNLFEHPFEHP